MWCKKSSQESTRSATITKEICDVKRVRKNQREARQLQKKYDELNLNIKFYSPDNKSRVNVYTLKTDVEQKYKDIGTDPIN